MVPIQSSVVPPPPGLEKEEPELAQEDDIPSDDDSDADVDVDVVSSADSASGACER
jgi:hypothetical protein